MLKKTRKIRKGGDIYENNIFRHIISIGYEMETPHLIKLSKIDDFFLNTDSANNYIKKFKEQLDEEENEDEDLFYRQLETLEIPTGHENISFYVTNDKAENFIVKKMSKICDEETDNENKDNLYKIKIKDEEYPIHFILDEDNPNCAVFSDVEWIITFFKPSMNSNIIIDTLSKAFKLLFNHLNNLELQKNVELIYNNPERGQEFENLVIYENNLYNSPNSNLYYFQPIKTNLDDICITIQMTFGTHISHIFEILKELIKDNLNIIECIQLSCSNRHNILINIETCVNELIESYNKNNSLHINPTIEIKNYMGLLLYKLYAYYNIYLQKQKKEKQTYFKDILTFNIRHLNFTLYNELKKELNKQLKMDNRQLAEIVQKIILQPDILYKYLVLEKNYVRKNAFSPNNHLDKSANSYGDPRFSLVSYFDFFENPIEENVNDWFQEKEIDIYSSKLDLKDNIIFIEIRNFSVLFSNYILSKVDKENKNKILDSQFGYRSSSCIKYIKQIFQQKSNRKTRRIKLL
jgi:hypothetical protein